MGHFNPRLREGGDVDHDGCIYRIKISIHASAREATASFRVPLRIIKFQSTPPRGRRRKPSGTSTRRTVDFNPRLREGGDDGVVNATSNCLSFQSTPPRGRRRTWNEGLWWASCISIHASAREATLMMN